MPRHVMHWMYLAYLIALGISVGLIEVAINAAYGRLQYYHGWSGWLLPPCSFLAGGELWLIASAIPAQRRRWNKSMTRAKKPRWYGILVGAIAGNLVGSSLGTAMGFNHLPAMYFVLLVSFGGPLPAVVWIYSLKPRAENNLDYNDQMPNPSPAFSIDIASLRATEAFGRRIGGLLFPNAVVALVGPLGAGKTQLSRAIAEGLEIANPGAVTSPTFTLIHEYPAHLPIYHFDAYRLNGPNEFLDLGVTEYFEAGGVCLIEWADKVEAALPDERLTIRITPIDETRRRVEIKAVGDRYAELARQL
ncbi:MAG TPA: tRNA (adenosine(37)-N6)-threonylcarbamoyltransferase complex ATPase subunit type 1 TsaE [Gemmataceae bacterium]|jgi:tRNA threonylcarbamoyladenosine biosynthesis protein TsaE|nr:tRNA (adenosine(37)-N6)-threonylcarbamoyltransferase complex ATPase subunit type 1 TsaE [Gemmataceae bacterium]